MFNIYFIRPTLALAIGLMLGLALLGGGCAQLRNLETAVQLGTASIANPITRDRLNQMESAATLVFIGLDGWKTSCIKLEIPQSCRGQIEMAQVYTRQIPPYLTQLRRFVRTNDQVNAIGVWNAVLDVIATVKAQAAAGGVTIKTTPGA